MRRIASAALLTAAFVCSVPLAGCDAASPDAPDLSSDATSASAARDAGAVVPGRFIVVLDEAPAALAGGRLAPQALDALEALATAPGVERKRTYTAALVGFSAELTDRAAAALRADPRVASVEPVRVATAAEAVTQTGATWGLDRVDQRARPLSGTYTYERTGAGVTAYVIDSGVRTTHAEFGGRAALALDANGAPVDFVGDGQAGADCSGHGTHVAASIGGATYGVAKGAALVSVRVIRCDNTTTTDLVLAGVDWVAANGTARPAVANLSIKAGASAALQTGLRNLIASGVTAVVAAGNDSRDACQWNSLAGVAEALVVGATTSADARASYSNFGGCLDLFAPGDQVLSASWESDVATRVRSGTSMGTAHASGAAALVLEGSPAASPAQITAALVGAATAGVVTDPKNGSPNRLLYTSPPQPPAPLAAAFTYACTRLACAFTDRSTGPVASWSWSFGNGAGSTAQSPSHTFAAAGTYAVTLTVADGAGATSAATQSVRVRR